MLVRPGMTVRLTIEHVLQTTEERFWSDVFGSEDFNRALYIDHLGFGYELESWDPSDGSRRARIWPVTNVPKTLSNLIGGEISFVEDGVYDEAAGHYDFHIIPSRLSERIDVRGRVETAPLADRTCQRTVTLDIEVRMFGVGSVMEAFLAKSTREQYGKNAAFINEYLAAVN